MRCRLGCMVIDTHNICNSVKAGVHKCPHIQKPPPNFKRHKMTLSSMLRTHNCGVSCGRHRCQALSVRCTDTHHYVKKKTSLCVLIIPETRDKIAARDTRRLEFVQLCVKAVLSSISLICSMSLSTAQLLQHGMIEQLVTNDLKGCRRNRRQPNVCTGDWGKPQNQGHNSRTTLTYYD